MRPRPGPAEGAHENPPDFFSIRKEIADKLVEGELYQRFVKALDKEAVGQCIARVHKVIAKHIMEYLIPTLTRASGAKESEIAIVRVLEDLKWGDVYKSYSDSAESNSPKSCADTVTRKRQLAEWIKTGYCNLTVYTPDQDLALKRIGLINEAYPKSRLKKLTRLIVFTIYYHIYAAAYEGDDSIVSLLKQRGIDDDDFDQFYVAEFGRFSQCFLKERFEKIDCKTEEFVERAKKIFEEEVVQPKGQKKLYGTTVTQRYEAWANKLRTLRELAVEFKMLANRELKLLAISVLLAAAFLSLLLLPQLAGVRVMLIAINTFIQPALWSLVAVTIGVGVFCSVKYGCRKIRHSEIQRQCGDEENEMKRLKKVIDEIQAFDDLPSEAADAVWDDPTKVSREMDDDSTDGASSREEPELEPRARGRQVQGAGEEASGLEALDEAARRCDDSDEDEESFLSDEEGFSPTYRA